MPFLKLFLNILFLWFFGFWLDLDYFFDLITTFFPDENFQIADPRDPASGGGNDGSDDEEIGSPGKAPPKKPFYQNPIFQIAVVACFFFLGGLAYAISGGDGQVQQQPGPQVPDARLAGGSADAINPPSSGGDAGGSD